MQHWTTSTAELHREAAENCGNTVPSEKGDTVARVDISLTSLVVLFVQPHFCVSFSSTTGTCSLALGTLPTIPGLHTMTTREPCPSQHSRQYWISTVWLFRAGVCCMLGLSERTDASSCFTWPSLASTVACHFPEPASTSSAGYGFSVSLRNALDMFDRWEKLSVGQTAASISATSQLAVLMFTDTCVNPFKIFLGFCNWRHSLRNLFKNFFG